MDDLQFICPHCAVNENTLFVIVLTSALVCTDAALGCFWSKGS
jgi:hypothetical protein